MSSVEKLVRVLRGACSGELAAGHAYRGHWRSVSSPATRRRLQEIEREEWHHRELVRGLLAQLDSRPSPVREAVFWLIGNTIGLLCHLGGWFIPITAPAGWRSGTSPSTSRPPRTPATRAATT